MHQDHFFDWHGFTFAVKMLAFLLIAGALGRYTLLYAAQSRLAGSPSLVLIQETRPAPPNSLSLSLSTTTSRHILNTLTIADVVPPTGKFIAADLATKVLTLYEEGAATAKYPILAEGEAGSLYEIPTGFYTVLAKEESRVGGDEGETPWSVQFYPNYFIHGWPARADGSPVDASYSGDGVRLATDDAEKVYAFAEAGTGLFVYDSPRAAPASLVLDAIPPPPVSAISYLVADLDTREVYLEQNAGDIVSIASTTRLVAVLVASEAIAFEKQVTLERAALPPAKRKTTRAEETFRARDLLYPLLAAPNSAVAEGLARAYGADGFVSWMNARVKALDMRSTRFADAVGTSTENVSTPEDLFRLAAYLANEKSFVLNMLRTPDLELVADSGNAYSFSNAAAVRNTALSLLSVPVNGAERHIAIIVLRSNDNEADTKALGDWFTQSALQGADLANTACITCVILPPYRKIQL